MLPTMTTLPVEPDGGGGPCCDKLRRCVRGSWGPSVHHEATPRNAEPTRSLMTSHVSHEKMLRRRHVSERASDSDVAWIDGFSAVEASSDGSVRIPEATQSEQRYLSRGSNRRGSITRNGTPSWRNLTCGERMAVSMSAFHHLTEAHALALGGVPMSFLRNETSHSRRGTSRSARQPRRACVAAARCC